MKISFSALVIALTLAVGGSIPTTGKAQGLFGNGFWYLDANNYGNAGDTGNVVVALDHAGAVGADQPNCTFTGSAEIDVVRVDNGNIVSQEAFDIDLSPAYPVQIDSYQFPTAPVGNALVAIILVVGSMPANCGAVVHRSVSNIGGLTTHIAPPVALKPGTYTVREVVPAGFVQTFPIFVPLGAGQLLNAALLGAPGSTVGPGPGDADCRIEGEIAVTGLQGDDTLIVEFEADGVAIVHDLTDATVNPVPSGETAVFVIKVTNNGPSDVSGSQPPCGIFTMTIGIEDEATGETTSSTGINIVSDPGFGIVKGSYS